MKNHIKYTNLFCELAGRLRIMPKQILSRIGFIPRRKTGVRPLPLYLLRACGKASSISTDTNGILPYPAKAILA